MNRDVHRGILSTIGATPLVELENFLEGFRSRVLVKMERHNPGGSIEDRTALSLMRDAIRGGELLPGSSLAVEVCSPDLAVSLAQVCRYYGIDFLAVVEGALPQPYPALLTAYGARAETVPAGAGRARVRELAASEPGVLWLSATAGPLQPQDDTDIPREIAEALDGQVDHILCDLAYPRALGGCAEYMRLQGRATSVIAVYTGKGSSPDDPLAVPFGVDEVVRVGAAETAVMADRLLLTQGILPDRSTAAAAAALRRIAPRIAPGSNCVLIAPVGGGRLVDTIEGKETVRS
ncbi:cysteine synthase [Streptomyces sp. LBL]|uniref:pyridoxal-phosphate dependent enzyme n=1 Tax=Streptomyces sp. LBL TaxID=2940562 RepID=UPI002474BB33|nr:pyridoxal-phosphate dependent enzyme [Streptomyces sp. LBL]MDH6626478.1 cysteine synthase [Streptomyces sp. LBL]